MLCSFRTRISEDACTKCSLDIMGFWWVHEKDAFVQINFVFVFGSFWKSIPKQISNSNFNTLLHPLRNVLRDSFKFTLNLKINLKLKTMLI